MSMIALLWSILSAPASLQQPADCVVVRQATILIWATDRDGFEDFYALPPPGPPYRNAGDGSFENDRLTGYRTSASIGPWAILTRWLDRPLCFLAARRRTSVQEHRGQAAEDRADARLALITASQHTLVRLRSMAFDLVLGPPAAMSFSTTAGTDLRRRHAAGWALPSVLRR
jgi:hypothetical protein